VSLTWLRGRTSLPFQIALLVAVALFVAQAINFGLLLREREGARFFQATSPAVTRFIDASERLDGGRALPPTGHSRRRVVLNPVNPIRNEAEAVPRVENTIRASLSDAGVRLGRVATGIVPIRRDDPFLRELDSSQRSRALRDGAVLTIAVEQPGRGWLTLSVPWPRTGWSLMWQLAAQTLILYGVVLIPVLWLGARIARPLHTLAVAASGFRPGTPAEAVEERGPRDVRAVIAAYNSLRTRVTAMIDEKDRMLGAIGHDLRTPLAALRVRIESVDDDVDRERMADIIEEMSRTLEDILSLARLGRPSEPPVETDLGALVDAVIDDFRDLGHAIDAEDPVRLKVRLRPGQMRRAVRNLIENAIKYAGGAEVRVAATPDGARIDVLDRGPGIPQDRLAHVFEPFIRIESSRNRNTGGIGLGLALARAIVAEAGGTLVLANRAGGGLAATITLGGGAR